MKNKQKMYLLYGIVYTVSLFLIFVLTSNILAMFIGDNFVSNIISLIISVLLWLRFIPYWNNGFKEVKDMIINN